LAIIGGCSLQTTNGDIHREKCVLARLSELLGIPGHLRLNAGKRRQADKDQNQEGDEHDRDKQGKAALLVWTKFN
jgi:hypothetical protein